MAKMTTDMDLGSPAFISTNSLGGFTTLRHLITTDGFSTLLAKYGSWIPGIGWFKWARISPPRSSYIPWGLAQRSGERVAEYASSTAGGGSVGGASDVTGGAITGPSSNVSTAFAFLPLVPTLFMAGMHFLAALRTQWSVRQIEKEDQRQTQYARQLNVMAMFLLIREQRLGWLAEKIRDYEEEEASKAGEAKGDDNDDDFEDIQDEEDEDSSDHRGPNLADTAAFISSLRHVADQEQDHTGDHHSDNTNRGSGQEGSSSSPPRRERIRLVDPKVLVLTFGPNLEKMDMQQFLMDPTERNRILRLEFEGMRDELMLFRSNMMNAARVQ